MKKERQIAIGIIEEFEELLDRFEIDIPAESRTGEFSEARIFGDNYYDLEDKITEILKEKLKGGK